jgi:hypothetical protein
MRVKNNQIAEQLSALVKKGELPAPQKPAPAKPTYTQGKRADKRIDPKHTPRPVQPKRPFAAKSTEKPQTPRSTVPVYRGPLVRESRNAAAASGPKQNPFQVTSVGSFADNGFRWARSASANERFMLEYSHGDLFQVAPNGQDSLTEVVLGVDFGTSSTKIIFRDTDRQTAYTVTFKTSTGQPAQFLPTALFKDNDSFSLTKTGVRIDDIKIRALKSGADDDSLAIAVAYLALVIRYSRSYLLTKYKSALINRDLLWRYHFGIPAADVRNFPVRDRFVRIARAAVLCSVGTIESIKKADCVSALQHCKDKSSLEIAFDDFPEALKHACYQDSNFFCDEAVKIWPEVMAQTHGFLRSNLWNAETMDRIMTVDVGAGTFDVSLCQISNPVDGNTDFAFTPLCVAVDGLGLRNFVRNRIERVLERAETGVIRGEIMDSVRSLDQISWVKARVPTPLIGSDGFFEGLETKGDPTEVDKNFTAQIGKMIWSDSALAAFSDRAHEERPILPVFLCGGGKFVDFYRERLLFYTEIRGIVVFSLKEIYPPEDLIDSDPTIFDRLSVAYGLAFADLGQFIDDGFGKPTHTVLKPIPQLQPKWADKFVDKDMV